MRDMMNVRVKRPAPYRQYADGFFTIAQTQNRFSIIGFDKNQEQQNEELKMRGGTLDLSDEYVITELAVAGLDIARVITEFEAGMRTRRMPLSSIMTKVEAFIRGLSHTPRHWS